MRLAPLLIVIALCACGPSPSAVAPLARATETPGLIIQSVSAQQTQSAAIYQSTQSAVDVQNANARIAEATARAEATFSAHSWSITRTVDAMMIAQMQYSATVQAQVTQAAQTQTAQTRIIADGQERARATATAEAIVRIAKEAAEWESTSNLLRGVLVMVAYAGGLTAILVIAIVAHSTLTQLRDITLSYFQAQADMKQAEADKARIIWRIVEERGKRQEIAWYSPPNGTPYQLLPEARIVDADPTGQFDDEREWKIALSRFVTHGGDKGFSYTRLGLPTKNSKPGQGLGVIDRRSWMLLKTYMMENGWLESDGEGSRTEWAGEWNKERFFSEVIHGDKPLPPFPIEKGVPNVRS